jgi:hypothetical protein
MPAGRKEIIPLLQGKKRRETGCYVRLVNWLILLAQEEAEK